MREDRWRLPARAAVAVCGGLVLGLATGCPDDDAGGTADTAVADTGGGGPDTGTPDAAGGDTGGGGDAGGDTGGGDTAGGGDTGGGDTGGGDTGGGDTGGGDTAGPDAGEPGNASVTAIEPVAAAGEAFSNPLDSTPAPDASAIYFTARSDEEPGVFRVGAGGGDVTTLAKGAPMASPLGIAISPDGGTLFLADPAAEEGDDVGRVFTLPAGGGNPTALSGTAGTQPRGVELAEAGDVVYFTGVDRDSGDPAVLSVPVSGGAVTVLAKGAPLSDPSGVAIKADGSTLYVTDTTASNGLGAVFEVTAAGVGATIAEGLGVGYPAGIALSLDETNLLVSGIDPQTGTDVVYRIDIATRAVQPYTEGISQNVDAGGVHRARNVDTYSWADLSTGTGGTVYLVKTKASAQ